MYNRADSSLPCASCFYLHISKAEKALPSHNILVLHLGLIKWPQASCHLIVLHLHSIIWKCHLNNTAWNISTASPAQVSQGLSSGFQITKTFYYQHSAFMKWTLQTDEPCTEWRRWWAAWATNHCSDFQVQVSGQKGRNGSRGWREHERKSFWISSILWMYMHH